VTGSNRYIVYNKWGDSPWQPGETWTLGSRDNQPVLKINFTSPDKKGATLDGTMVYDELEGPIHFTGTRTRPSPAETPVETTSSPEGGPDATPRAAVPLASPASNPAPDDATALGPDNAAATPEKVSEGGSERLQGAPGRSRTTHPPLSLRMSHVLAD
jgi:OAA-family lectin sugar binding domain